MKKIILTTAVVLAALFSSASANAELALLTTNGGSFDFDPENNFGGSSLVTNGDEGLSDLAIILGYRSGPVGNVVTETVLLNSGSAGPDPDFAGANFGRFTFDQVEFSNGVTVDAIADFRLTDVTGFTTDPQSQVLYELELTTSGVNAATEGSLLSFVGFDFNGDGSDSFQPSSPIPGFGNSLIGVGDSERALLGDFTFSAGDGLSLIHI